MKLYIQTLGVSALMIFVSSAGLNIYETQTAFMQEISARIRKQTLTDKQMSLPERDTSGTIGT